MAINKKLITFDKKSTFLGANGINNVSSPTDGYYHNIPEWSMVFILETGEIWHNGKYFGRPIKDQIFPATSQLTKGIVFMNNDDYYYRSFNLWGNVFDGSVRDINGELVVQGETYKWTYGDGVIRKGNANLIAFSGLSGVYDVFIPSGDLSVTGGDLKVGNNITLASTGSIKGTHILNTNSYFNLDYSLGKTWNSIKLFNTSGTLISLDSTRPAIINIQAGVYASGTNWLPWITGGDVTELSSWGIGLGGDAFYIGRISKSNTENSLSQYWKFDSEDGITISGTTKYIKVADLAGASEKIFMADGTVKALSDIASESLIGEATTTNYGGFKLTQNKSSVQQTLVSNTTGNGRYAVKMNADGTLFVEFVLANTWLPATNTQGGYVPQLSGSNDAISSSLNDYVLTFTSSDAETITPTWRRLPSNAFDNTWRGIYVDNTSKLGTGITTKPINFKAGSGITLTFTAAGDNAYNTLQIDGTTYSTATDSTLGLVKVGTTLDDVTGFTAIHIKDGKIYYKDTTYSFSNLKFQLTSGTDLMTYNSLSAKTILAGTGITFSYLDNVLTISSAIYSTATNSILGLVKVGTTLEDTTGYTKVHIDDSGFIYYHDTTYSFSKLKFQQTSGTDLMTYDSQAARTILAGDNITFTHSSNVLTIKATDTWTKFIGATDNSNGTAGYIDAPGKSNKNNFLRGDGTWLSLESNVTSALYVGASNGTSTAALSTNGSVYLIFKEGSSYSRYQITGSGRASVTSDSSGNITISSSGYSNFTAATASAAGSAGLVPGPGANQLGSGGYYLKADGTWGIPTNTWKEVSTSQEGYVPKIVTTGSLAATDSPFILVFKNVSGSTKTAWVPLPANAFKNDNTWTPWAGATASANGTAGYMPAPTSALRGQFLRGDGTWVSLNNYSLPTASSSTLGGVKTGATITDTTGYTAVAIKDGIIYYKDTNTTYTFSNLLFLQTSGTNLMTYNSQATRTVLAGSNITFTHSNNVLTIAAKDTTYGTVSKSAAGLCPALPNETTTTKYLRLDGTWVAPPNDNTWKAANTSLEGYVPKLTTNGGTIATQSTEYVLAFKSGTDSTPVWRLLPANAYKNTWIAWKGATSSANGTAGYMPAPTSEQRGQFLRGDGSWVSLNNYSLTKATTSALGGIIVSNVLTTAVALTSSNGTTTNRYYGVQLDKDGKAFVNIPWVWTAFTAASSDAAGTAGYIQAPKGALNKFFRGDNTWLTINLNVTSALYVGASNGTSTSAQSTNGNVYLIFAEGSSYSRYKISGSGRASVTSDASGNITINSSGYSNFGAATASAAGSAGLVPAPGANKLGTGGYFLRADGSWEVPTNTWNLGSSSQAGYVPKATKNYFLHCNNNTGDLEWVANPNTWRNIYVKGSSKIGTGTNTKAINFAAGSNVSITYEAAGTEEGQSGSANYFNIKIAATNTWNANAVGVAGYVAAPTKANNANMTWLTDANGNPAWRASNNHSHSYLPLSGGTLSNSSFGTQLIIERSGSANMAAIGFKNSNGILGYLATNTVDSAFVRYNAAVSAYYTILDSSNSSVSKSGETLTVKINGTSQSLTNTNTWRGIQDNLTSSSNTTESLSAKQGYLLANGSARDSTKLPLAGGTMTGDITMGTRHYIYGVNETSGSMLHFDGNRTIVGSVGSTSTLATHLRSITGHLTVGTSSTASYNVLDSGNYSEYIKTRCLIVDGGGNYILNSPYDTDINIMTTHVTLMVTSSGNTDKRPILVGASSSSAVEPSFSTTTSSVYAAHRLFMQPSTGNLYLYSPSNDSPALYFQRGDLNTENNLDWRIFDTGGNLVIQNNSGSWHDSLKINYSGGMTVDGKQVLCLDQTYSLYNPAYARVRSILIGGTTYDFWSPFSNTTVDIDSAITNKINAYYWANIKISTTSSTTTTPTFSSVNIGGANNSIGTDGNGTNLWIKVGDAYVNFAKNAFRRGTGTASSSIALGTSTYPWGGLYTTFGNFSGRLTVNSGAVNITGEGNYSEGIRIHNCGDVSSVWFRCSGTTGYDAGMWGITANSNGLRFRGSASTSGTSPNDYMNILYGGNVGIGKTDPNHKLEVAGNISLYAASGDSPYLYFQRGTSSDNLNGWRINCVSGALNFNMSSSGTWSSTPMLQLTTTAGTAYLNGATILTTSNTPQRYLKVDGGGNYLLYSPYNTDINITTTNVTQIVTSSDNTYRRPILVGANSSSSETPTFSTTTSSVYALHTVFILPSTGNLYLYNSAGGDSPALYFQRGDFNTGGTFDWRMYVSGGHFYLQNDNGTLWHTSVFIDYTNDYITAGGFKKSGSNSSYVLTGDGGHKAISDFALSSSQRTLSVDGSTYTLYSPYNTQINVTTTNVTQTISTSSNTNFRPLLVSGVTSTAAATPTFTTGTGTVISMARLYVQPSTGNLYLYNPNNGQDSPMLYFQRGAMDYSYIDWRLFVSGGEFIFSSDSGNSWATRVKFSETGNVYAPNYYTTSDRAKKYNISKLSEHISKFTLKDTNKDAYGVIAQEVPEMFRDGKEGNMTVNYNSVLSYYVGQLENRVKELEDRLKKYEDKVKKC